ncbi:MAG: hypothetical protein KGL39_03095 [Patescibacteria group bacterium]|nr:hypothetical protein [Patescibacteria group bacterium]
MIPVHFKEANCKFGAPPDLSSEQVMTVSAYQGQVAGGSVDGSFMVVVAWKPTPVELADLCAGGAVYLCCLGGLPPHTLSTSFEAAIHPA